jgi:hypothetical protein
MWRWSVQISACTPAIGFLQVLLGRYRKIPDQYLKQWPLPSRSFPIHRSSYYSMYSFRYLLLLIVLLLLLYSPFSGLGRFSVSWSYTQSVGLLGRGISQWQGRYLHTEQHKHRIKAHNTDNISSCGIRTHDLSVPASEDSSCLRPRGHCDRLRYWYHRKRSQNHKSKIAWHIPPGGYSRGYLYTWQHVLCVCSHYCISYTVNPR